MSTRIDYEWTAEGIDEHGDIQDSHFAESLADLLREAEDLRAKWPTVDIGLVRDDSDGDRAWAYLDDAGNLPDDFRDAYDRPVAKVPQRFRDELRRANGGKP